MTSRPGSLLVVLPLFWFASSTGCTLHKGDVRMGPLFSLNRQENIERTAVDILGPLFHYEKSIARRHLAFRPLFDWTAEGTGGDRLLFLWPLGLYEKAPGKTHFRIFPLLSYKKRIKGSRGMKDSDFMLLPFLFAGKDSEEGSYFALFPLIGHLKGLLTREDLRFFLFPLYSDSRKGDNRAWNLLYPVFHLSRGGSKSSFRVWPLAGRKTMADRYDKRFFLWPLVTSMERTFMERPPMRSLFVLPFYGHKETFYGTTRHFLPPFFSRTKGTGSEESFLEWNAPWPVVVVGRGSGYRKLTFWPLMWYRKRPEDRSLIAPFPLYWQSERTQGDESVTRRWLVPFYWSTERTCEAQSQGSATRRFWPILDLRRRCDGTSDLWVLSPLWFRDPHGFERAYGPLWTLYRSREDVEGRRSTQILWHYFGDRMWWEDDPEAVTKRAGSKLVIPWTLPGLDPETGAREE